MTYKKQAADAIYKLAFLKPLLYIVLIPSVFIVGVMVLANKGQTNSDNTGIQVSGASYELNKTTYSFGEISMKDGNVETSFELTNTAQEEIYVKELFTSCMCTKAQIIFSNGTKTGLYGMKGHGGAGDFYVGKSIKAGEKVLIRTIFDPNAHGPQGVGYIKRNITMETNLKDNKFIQVTFDAQVVK